MEGIGNGVLQLFGNFILPLMLPIFLLALLMGMRRPEHLLEEVFGLIEVILGILVAVVFALLKTLLKFVAALFQPKGKYDSGGYHGGNNGDWKRKPQGPAPRAERISERIQ